VTNQSVPGTCAANFTKLQEFFCSGRSDVRTSLDIRKVEPLRAYLGQNKIQQLTNPALDPYAFSVYYSPVLTCDPLPCTSNTPRTQMKWISTWAQMATIVTYGSYSSFQDVFKNVLYSRWDSVIAIAGLSAVADLPNGAAAWAWIANMRCRFHRWQTIRGLQSSHGVRSLRASLPAALIVSSHGQSRSPNSASPRVALSSEFRKEVRGHLVIICFLVRRQTEPLCPATPCLSQRSWSLESEPHPSDSSSKN